MSNSRPQAPDPDSARGRALTYLENERTAGRGRVLLPEPLAAARVSQGAATGSSAGEPAEPAPAPAPASSTATATATAATSSTPASGTAGPRTFGPLSNLRDDATVAGIAKALGPIDARAQVCTACDLSKTRKKVVFGTGSGRSGIVFVGEAPGASEDEQGVPFVGRAGQLLDKILVAIGIAREDVYICNVLKCRPPGNRDPQPNEAAMCAPFLREQLEELRPRVICALGLHAVRRLLQVPTPMGKLRGQVMEYQGIPTIATYHPAALLRNPSLKRPTWEDFQLLRKIAEESQVA